MQGRTSMCDCGNILNAFCKGQKLSRVYSHLCAKSEDTCTHLEKYSRPALALGLSKKLHISRSFIYLYGYAKKILSLAVNISISIA